LLEIDQKVISMITTDVTMAGYLNGTLSDNRIYAWYPVSDIAYTIGFQEVAIIFRDSLGGRPYEWSYPSQIPHITYFFRILSINQILLSQCKERLIVLFDQKSIETTNWYVKYVELASDANGMTEGSPTQPIMSRNVNFLFKEVFRKG